MKKTIGFIVAFLALTGCHDRLEIENRAFAVSLGVDKGQNGGYNITLSIPVAQEGGRGYINVSETGSSIYAAMEAIDSKVSKKVDYGQMKFIIFGESILNDEALFKGAVGSLERNPEINRQINVMASDMDARGVLCAELNGEGLAGSFIADYYRNYSSKNKEAFKQTIESFVKQMGGSGSALMPKITADSGSACIGGAGLIKNNKLAGFLNEGDLNGYMHFKNLSGGMVLQADFEGRPIALKITRPTSRVNCYESGGLIYCDVEVKCKGRAPGFFSTYEGAGEVNELEALFEGIIKEDIIRVGEKFSNEFSADGFGIFEILRKYNHNLYLEYKGAEEQALAGIVINPIVSVDILGAPHG
ncbi:MAG: Ger(x)C family spore germination protein [Clostridiales bacterium]|jgi:Ger(x)C family germination protein|nr:Ger(x)C family spore germination protein [Clostridiales bacterium]